MTHRAPGSRVNAYSAPRLGVHPWNGDGVRVIVAHPMRVLAPALRLQLADRGQVLSQTSSGRAAVSLAELLAPRVVLIGEVLEDGYAEHFLPRVLQSGARAVIVGDQLEGENALRLLRLGAAGLVPLTSPLAYLSDAILRVASGEVVVPADVLELVLGEWRTKPPPARRASLTERELDVLVALAEGLSTKAIARRLGIAYKTAENHKTRIFQKLGITNQAEALTLVHSGEWSKGERLCVRGPGPPGRLPSGNKAGGTVS